MGSIQNRYSHLIKIYGTRENIVALKKQLKKN